MWLKFGEMDMIYRKLPISIFTILLMLASFPLPAQQSRPGILPDHVTVQYAGSIGLVAGGFGYRNNKGNIESELLLGYLPASVGGDRLLTAAMKSNWLPFKLFDDKPFAFYPIQTGVMISYTFGEQFWGTQPSYYPDSYYSFSTAWHAYWQIGSRLSLPLKNKQLEVYYEFNASAEEIVAAFQNPNFLSPDKFFNLAIGVKLHFEP